ncbi:MAG: alanine racemase [Bdellovibrionales bacterium]|nr:alanine racemase [Bdellovibrionales bacterium]
MGKRPDFESNLSRLQKKLKTGVGPDDESMDYEPRVVCELSGKALVKNFEAIRDQAKDKGVIPMIKANGYGHGLTWAAQTLSECRDVAGFGVATLEEGLKLRTELSNQMRRHRIIVFSGATDFTEEKGRFCLAHGLTPVLSSEESWNLFDRAGFSSKLPYELEFNTGMNRLGIPDALAPKIAKRAKEIATRAEGNKFLSGVFSHFATAEDPNHRVTRDQLERFRAVRSVFSDLGAVQFHMANSAAIWNQKQIDSLSITDLIRPGISLYGVPPFPGAPEKGIQPVMRLKARIIQITRLKPGESVGYGATYTVSGSEAQEAPVFMATLSAGYADGLHRSLSGPGKKCENGGYVWISGKASRFAGIISMDLSSVFCGPEAKVGDWVEWLGSHIDPWSQAKLAGSVPYELLTSVTDRVKRIYVD